MTTRASWLDAQAQCLEQIAASLRTEAAMLRLGDREAPMTRTVMQYAQPLSIHTAFADEPMCDTCGEPRCKCLGTHPEGR